jgi:hypothetical protein
MQLRNWTKANKVRLAALGITALAAAGTGLAAVGSTGAYFSDTHSGTISGTVGSIHVSPNGGKGADNMDFTFSNLLPGESQTATLNYENVGHNAQDVWLVFPNATALSALNNLGTYGEVHVVSNGTEIFGSKNLNDNATTCPSCNPLPAKLKLASSVAPGATGTVSFAFNYASKLKGQPTVGQTAVWNSYPVGGQVTTVAADGTGSGLPYQLVAVQQGQTP